MLKRSSPNHPFSGRTVSFREGMSLLRHQLVTKKMMPQDGHYFAAALRWPGSESWEDPEMLRVMMRSKLGGVLKKIFEFFIQFWLETLPAGELLPRILEGRVHFLLLRWIPTWILIKMASFGVASYNGVWTPGWDLHTIKWLRYHHWCPTWKTS